MLLYNAALSVLHQCSDEHEEVEEDDELGSWLVVLVHDDGITRRRSHGMDGGTVPGHAAVII